METKLCFLFQFCFLLLLLQTFPSNGVSQATVEYLPGFDGPLPFHLETGYVNIDDSDDIQLFYYFFKSESNPVDDPLIVWFTGGPGCSGLSAILFENGPVKLKVVEYNGSIPTLELNPYSWTKVSNMVFIDAPVGTGFSYARTLQGSYSDDILSAKQGHSFIRQWLTDHSEFLENPLYIGGDSYSGKIVPGVVQDISNGIEVGDKPLLNLKGYLLGNPVTYRYMERNYWIPFAHGMGIISDELFESLMKNCGGDYVNEDASKVQCNLDMEVFNKDISGVNQFNILDSDCMFLIPEPKEIVRDRNKYEKNSSRTTPRPDPDSPCNRKAIINDRRSLQDNSSGFNGIECKSAYGYSLSYYWANDEKVQKALHVRKGKVQRWRRCNQCGINFSMIVENAIYYHLNISKKGCYRSLIYHGDHDFGVPFMSTQEWIRSLNYSISDEWRPWLVDGQVAGYTRTYTNDMTFATVKGAGHLALEYKPKECLVMLKRWLSYKYL